ncbi:MAG TPA: hypothetical protein RMG48_03465 [Myxococcales bacterium LLY-WYZ-16_1]|nr:hypothetical protein [Myxococcales bacterium LLY-WYZ-16_1]
MERPPEQLSTLDVWSVTGPASGEHTTTLAAFTEAPLPENRLLLTVEAFVFTAMAVAVGHAAGAEHASIIALFLTTAGLSSRTKSLQRDLERRARGRDVLAIALRSELLLIFVGVFSMYLAWTAALGPEGISERFAFAVRASGLSRDASLADGLMKVPAAGLIGHNLLVACSAFTLAFIYRSYGFLLVLTWNASVWATSSVLLVHQAVATSPHPAVATVATVAMALLPHLMLEATAYGVAGLAGNRAGVYLFRHPAAMRSGFSLLAAALVLTLLASVLELTWPRFVLSSIL